MSTPIEYCKLDVRHKGPCALERGHKGRCRLAGDIPCPVVHPQTGKHCIHNAGHPGGCRTATNVLRCRVCEEPIPPPDYRTTCERADCERVAAAKWWLNESMDEGAIGHVDMKKAAPALARLIESERKKARDEIEAELRRAGIGRTSALELTGFEAVPVTTSDRPVHSAKGGSK